MRPITIILSILLFIPSIYSYTVTGEVTDSFTGEPVSFATVFINPEKIPVQTDIDGKFTVNMSGGPHEFRFSYIGYRTMVIKRDIVSDALIDAILTTQSVELAEVVVSARESEGITSVSRIDRDAMQHLQPTSFADILELLPGNISKDPDMGSVNTIALHETGTLGATGNSTKNDDYSITSLGTLFVVDGAPINTDANLQSIGGLAPDSNSPFCNRNITNRGVDMRTISTDNIESVEIVRGIPSSEYGNLTSGMVNIKRVRRSTPFTARFKADEFSKLFSAGKGFQFHNSNHILNFDFGYLDSKTDPRNSLENFKRLNFSVRANMRFESDVMTYYWNIGNDYSGSFDNARVDPDLNYNKIDKFKNEYNRFSINSELNLDLKRDKPISNIVWNMALSYERDMLRHIKQIAPARASVAPTSMEEGVHDGEYLLTEYIADYRSEGEPFTAFSKIKLSGSCITGSIEQKYLCGLEWNMSKNYGRGQVYDLTRPLSAGWTTRPRDYSTVPALHNLATYIQDNIKFNAGRGTVELQTGLRATSLPSLDSRYSMSGRIYLDPRVNTVWNMSGFKIGKHDVKITLGGGYGLTTRMPTADYIYPQGEYSDFIQLNYYNTVDPSGGSRISLRTYINDPTNYKLKPARNSKYEIRGSVSVGKTRISVTGFYENLTSGFRYSAIFSPFEYTKYDTSSVSPDLLTSPPELQDLPATEMKVLDGYRRVTNGSRIRKQGVEFQLTTPRWKLLATSLIVNGAWLRTTYTNSMMLFKPVNDVVGETTVRDIYVGLYDSNDGRMNTQFNTNFMFDTQIPRWGLLLTTSVQCVWHVSTTRLRESSAPESYISAEDGELHPFTEAAVERDPVLQYLVKIYSNELYKPYTVPTAIYFNMKATKQIGRHLRISGFVNRIVDYLPDYTRNGLVVRRSTSPYFGMEINLSI